MLASSDDFSIVCSHFSVLEEGLGVAFGPFIFFLQYFLSALCFLTCYFTLWCFSWCQSISTVAVLLFISLNSILFVTSACVSTDWFFLLATVCTRRIISDLRLRVIDLTVAQCLDFVICFNSVELCSGKQRRRVNLFLSLAESSLEIFFPPEGMAFLSSLSTLIPPLALVLLSLHSSHPCSFCLLWAGLSTSDST